MVKVLSTCEQFKNKNKNQTQSIQHQLRFTTSTTRVRNLNVHTLQGMHEVPKFTKNKANGRSAFE